MRVLFLSENIMNPEIIPHKYNYDVAIFPWDKIFLKKTATALAGWLLCTNTCVLEKVWRYTWVVSKR